MERAHLPDRIEEEERYKAHQNSPQDAGYVRFLNQAIAPALGHLNATMRGLDYGCGPVPTLSGLLLTHGLQCQNYDPYFYPDVPDKNFDFIFSTEVVEHFFYPCLAFQHINELLNPGGILTIMTEQWHTLEKFSEWHYAKDMTHVSFYHANTIAYICTRYGFERINPASPSVSVLKKASLPTTTI